MKNPFGILVFILCTISMIFFSIALVNQAEKAHRAQKQVFYLQDALKLKTSIVQKEDSAYMVWSTDHALRTRVKNELSKLK